MVSRDLQQTNIAMSSYAKAHFSGVNDAKLKDLVSDIDNGRNLSQSRFILLWMSRAGPPNPATTAAATAGTAAIDRLLREAVSPCARQRRAAVGTAGTLDTAGGRLYNGRALAVAGVEGRRPGGSFDYSGRRRVYNP